MILMVKLGSIISVNSLYSSVQELLLSFLIFNTKNNFVSRFVRISNIVSALRENWKQITRKIFGSKLKDDEATTLGHYAIRNLTFY
jgi:hypothetical protein